MHLKIPPLIAVDNPAPVKAETPNCPAFDKPFVPEPIPEEITLLKKALPTLACILKKVAPTETIEASLTKISTILMTHLSTLIVSKNSSNTCDLVGTSLGRSINCNLLISNKVSSSKGFFRIRRKTSLSSSKLLK